MLTTPHEHSRRYLLSLQNAYYDADMPPMPTTTIRLSPAQRRMLQRLQRKLHIDQTNVIRLAITRLAEAEGLLPEEKR